MEEKRAHRLLPDRHKNRISRAAADSSKNKCGALFSSSNKTHKTRTRDNYGGNRERRTHARTHARMHPTLARHARHVHTHKKRDGGHTCSSVKGPSFPRDTAFFALPLLSCIVPEPPPHRRTNFCAFIDEQNPKDTILVHASSNMVSGGKQHRQPATETPPGCPAAPPFAVKDPSLPLLPPPPLVNIYPSRLSLYLPVSLSPCLTVSLSPCLTGGNGGSKASQDPANDDASQDRA